MKYLSVTEVAEKWNLSERTIRNYCADGKIVGATQSGRNWMIPENANKPQEEENFDVEIVRELKDFLDNSPVNYFAIKNVKDYLVNNGYREIYENKPFDVKKGDKVFVIRNGTTLIALNVGNKLDKYAYHIVASHCDSPCFKLKAECNSETDQYKKISVEPYGGMLCSTWLDRPLSVAGRVLLKTDSGVSSQLINLDNQTVMIPNKCIHFNREANSGYEYNFANDMQPFYAFDSEIHFEDVLANKLKTNAQNIKNFDLFLYNAEKATIWGLNKEFISSSRLDDLECVFTSLKGFIASNNESAVNVLYMTDNEEVGSSSAQGADGDFLDVVLRRVNSSLGLSEDEYHRAIASSFLVSADNAHAVHPNFPGITDAQNKCYMNKGVAIKFNASNRYTSDAVSASIFETICDKANVPYQHFANRSDMRGGSTLGNILLSHVSMLSVDIGLPQLAMHSSYETAGSKDVIYAEKMFKEFYSSNIEINGDNYKVSK